jgi:transcriptional regulator with XRE-family HTH domain
VKTPQLQLAIRDSLEHTQPKPCERADRYLELMPEPTTLGSWLRRERERRGVTLSQISEQTKVSVPLLEGLEADDLSRWPGGIFRRSFARSYAGAIGLDGDLVVKRIEESHPDPTVVADAPPKHGKDQEVAAPAVPGATLEPRVLLAPRAALESRVMAVALDLLVAVAIAFGFAAGGSRLLWPVVAIAAYHALGVLLAGTTPMLAIVAAQRDDDVGPQRVAQPSAPESGRRAEPQQARRHRSRRGAGRIEPARLDRQS